ncbi:DUF1573 domain-containing protein [bacterium]|nr:DUF1573 domain-containing protein [bacterium]
MKCALGLWLALVGLSSAAGLEFSSMLKEVNAPADATIVTTDFEFTNKGDKPMSITKTDPGCSCLKVEISGGKLKYAPGESGVVRATFEMGNFSGTVDKMVALWVDDDPSDKPSKQLVVRVNIPVLVAIEPKTVKWDLGGKATPQVIQIRMAGDKPIRVIAANSSSESFACEIKTLEEGRKYDLIVTPKEMNAPGMTVIRIETDCAISKHRTQQAFAVVRKPTPASKP